jgi:glycerol-3-phosphate dehydrogenase
MARSSTGQMIRRAHATIRTMRAVLWVELALARERDLALSDEDVLVRRTRLSTMDAAAAERLGLVTAARGKGDRRWSARDAGSRTSDEGR